MITFYILLSIRYADNQKAFRGGVYEPDRRTEISLHNQI